MKLKIIAIGTRMPNWVNEAWSEYAVRMPAEMSVELIEIPAPKRGKNPDSVRLIAKEGEQMLAAIDRQDIVIALDEHGKMWDTVKLSQQMDHWRNEGCNVCFLIGGADGLAPACKARANIVWSLSALTLPHPFVRPIVAEQLYRAWTLLTNHPYHRA
mgnify:CR=1 FL=1|tara:strand:- start:83915 stop:84385 length:471 start_codon:yes stop_codon:yes gene_type:complete